ncbi:unnamed protein product [Diatraea saccharalis]|uniref:Chitin synthase regulatory factor 2 n=1 Tax=Diatraea saccharalis TaxID=40085 RepID=A0A9N9RBI6_9NEOP|nr:unnamed protein product [Diatraea saccharalis]
MWKYMTRRIRDTFERGANHFDKRGTTGVVNAGNINEENKKTASPCSWIKAKRCFGPSQRNNTNNNNGWNFVNLTSSWMDAITWSGALVISWYTSQLIQWKYKYYIRRHNESGSSTLLSTLHPYISSVNKNPAYLKSDSKIEKLVGHFTPIVHLITNEQDVRKERIHSTSSSSTNLDSSNDILGDVLNSIENKLGLAAIENGQLQDGLNLLRSAANRSYAPALYNLAICYEMGMGVIADEKMAMELYRSAAALEHPGALYNLGIYYGQGRGGLPRDTVTATRLLRLAAVQGQKEAIAALKSLNIDTQEPSHNKTSHQWFCNPGDSLHDNIVPIPTTLFVENVNYCPKNIDATVY